MSNDVKDDSLLHRGSQGVGCTYLVMTYQAVDVSFLMFTSASDLWLVVKSLEVVAKPGFFLYLIYLITLCVALLIGLVLGFELVVEVVIIVNCWQIL